MVCVANDINWHWHFSFSSHSYSQFSKSFTYACDHKDNSLMKIKPWDFLEVKIILCYFIDFSITQYKDKMPVTPSHSVPLSRSNTQMKKNMQNFKAYAFFSRFVTVSHHNSQSESCKNIHCSSFGSSFYYLFRFQRCTLILYVYFQLVWFLYDMPLSLSKFQLHWQFSQFHKSTFLFPAQCDLLETQSSI